MTPAQIIALVRDAAIVAALAFILWYVHRADVNSIAVADFKAVQKQVETNAKTISQWHQEAQDAEIKRQQDMDRVSSSIASQHAPIVLRVPPSSSTVPGNPPSPSGGSACTGGSTEGPGVDLRPQINAFESKYEEALGQCRAVLASWPH